MQGHFDETLRRAILREIGERLQAGLREDEIPRTSGLSLTSCAGWMTNRHKLRPTIRQAKNLEDPQ
jgi:hypothetical protein